MMLAQTPTIGLFAPVLFAAFVALLVQVLGRVVAESKYDRAIRANANWAPSIPAGADFPLNQVDPRPRRRTLQALLEPSELELELSDIEVCLRAAAEDQDPADSASITTVFCRCP